MDQTCKHCGRVDPWDFTIDDEVWRNVVPPHLMNRVVCLHCFDRFASEKGILYEEALWDSLFFIGPSGEALCFRLARKRHPNPSVAEAANA